MQLFFGEAVDGFSLPDKYIPETTERKQSDF